MFKLIFLLILPFYLFGLEKSEIQSTKNVWNNLSKLESNYNAILNDNNDTLQDKLLNENTKIFQEVFNTIKNEEITNTSKNKFFDNFTYQNRIDFLNRRIESNGYSNNITAIHRDLFEMNYLNIKKNIFDMVRFINENGEKQNFKKLLFQKLKKQQLTLEDLNPKKFKEYVNDELLTNDKSYLKEQAFKKFLKYKTIYYLYKDFIEEILKENQITLKDQLLEELYVNKLINEINNNKYIDLKPLNRILSKINLDVGRFVGFIIVLLIFTILGIILNKIIVDKATKQIEKKVIDEEEKEIIHLAFFRIKLPFLIVMAVTSFHISLWILYLNTSPNEVVKEILHTLYIISISWFLFTLIDIIALYVVNSKKYVKRIKQRKELINLGILSVKTVLVIITFIILLHFWGVNVSGILTGLGIGGIAIGFAAKDLLSNFFGTISIIINDVYSQGEWIEVNGVDGTVAELNFGTTKIRTFSNGLISIPNHVMSNSTILNWNRRKHGRQIKTVLGLTYNSNKQDIINAINDINNYLENHPEIATPNKSYDAISKERKNKLISVEDTYGIKRTLFVKFIGFSESSVDILIYAYSKTVNWGEFMDVRQEVYLKIWDIIEKNNLEFAYPTQTLFIEENKKQNSLENLV
jgi:MscS family membrane protein